MAPVILFLLLLLISSLSLITRARRRSRQRQQLLPLPPGPKGWPLFGNLFQLGSKPHQTLQTLSKTHGSSGLLHLRFCVADVIVISSASAAAQCFRHHDANFSNRPRNSTAKYIAYGGEELVMAPYGARWRAMRKLCAQHLFGPKALDGWRGVREEEVRRLAGELRRMGLAVSICAANILTRALVGRRVALGGQFLEMVAEATRLAGVFNIGDFVPWIHWLDLQDSL